MAGSLPDEMFLRGYSWDCYWWLLRSSRKEWKYRLNRDKGMKSWLILVSVPASLLVVVQLLQNILAVWNLSNQKSPAVEICDATYSLCQNQQCWRNAWWVTRKSHENGKYRHVKQREKKIRKTHFPAMWYHKQERKAWSGTHYLVRISPWGNMGFPFRRTSLMMTWTAADWTSIADTFRCWPRLSLFQCASAK